MKKKKIVLINGSGGVGKDEFIKQCNNHCYAKNISSVDIVKKAGKLFGWDGISKDEKTRKFLSDLKLLSTDYSNHPFEYMKSEIDTFMSTHHASEGFLDGVIFCHIREPEELQKMKDAFDCITLIIKNNRVEQVTSNMADAGVYNFIYDYYIENNGTVGELQESALTFLKNIFEEGEQL